MTTCKLFLGDRTLSLQQLLDECSRCNFDVLILADDDEGPPFQAVIALRGDDTGKFLKALLECESELNEDARTGI